MSMSSTLPETDASEPTVIDTEQDGMVSFTGLNRRGVKTVVIVLAVLLVVELVARVLASGLPNPDWNFAQTDRKVAEMQALADAGEEVDLVLLGNSSVNGAFTNDGVAAATGADGVFNAGLDGSSMRQTEDWALNVVVPLLSPETVVIGLTSRDLNDASSSNADVFRDYLNSRGRARFLGEETAGQRIQRALSEVSALVRISPFLRDPASLITQYNPDGPATGEFVLPGEDYNPRQLDITRTRERALNDYSLGGIELESLTRLVDELEAQGITVVIMEMPYVAEDYLELHPNGVSDYGAYRAVVEEFTAERNLPYIDLTTYPWTTNEFYDFLHVNSAGIAIINQLLANGLAGALEG